MTSTALMALFSINQLLDKPTLHLIFGLITLLISMRVQSAELMENNLSVRSLGMGGVYGPVVKDAESLYFNTANLGRTTGVQLELFNIGAGVNGLEAVNQLSSINGASSSSDLLQYVGNRYWIGGNGRATFVMPYFGFGLYNSAQMSFDLQNPVLPEFRATYYNDTVIMLGSAMEVTKDAYLGINIKQVMRVGGAQSLDTASLLNSSNLQNIANQFADAGVGYGFGMSYVQQFQSQMRPLLSVTWDDVGQTSFRKTGGSAAPSAIKDNLSVGVSTLLDLPGLDWTTGIEYRHAMNYDHELGKKIHLGTEISLPLIDLRAGLNQGYMSYGVGVDLLFLSLDAAYYDVELGAYPGQDQQNRIVIGANMAMGFDADFKVIFGELKHKKKLKQRR